MFRTIVSSIDRDRDTTPRQFTLDVNSRVLNGTLYDHLAYGFHDEKTGNGEYVPIRSRRPCVRHNLCRLVAQDSVSLLFSEGHFPTPLSNDKPTKQAADKLIKATRLNETMLEAAVMGSVGSVAIHMRVLAQDDSPTSGAKIHKVFFKPHATTFLTPTWAANDPERLAGIREQYKIRGRDLKAVDYPIEDDDLNAVFWFARQWDTVAENWIVPWKVEDDEDHVDAVDDDRSVTHNLGFVPWVWVKNLPGKLKLFDRERGATPGFSDIDGECTFDAAIETMIELEYLLSQGGRGLKYSMDPTLLLKEPAATPDGEIVKSPGNALVVDADGDAKMLEIGGTAFTVVLEYVRALREYALESIHGNRAEASKLATAQSGRAMEMMNEALIWLADRLKVSYGEGALLALIRMALKAHEKFPLLLDDEVLELGKAQKVTLKWPKWHSPTSHDLQEQATTVTTLTDSGVMSRETAVSAIADNYDIEDIPAELARIDADIEKASAVIEAQGGQPKPSEAAPV